MYPCKTLNKFQQSLISIENSYFCSFKKTFELILKPQKNKVTVELNT